MEYAQTILTVDLVVVVKRGEIVLIERGEEPFKGKLALPGGHFDPEVDATLVASALREGREEIGLDVPLERLKFMQLLDAQDRDPRPGRRVSAVYQVHISPDEADKLHAGSDAKSVVRRSIEQIDPSEMAFDHGQVIKRLQFVYSDRPRS